jgi:hypothetical protein
MMNVDRRGALTRTRSMAEQDAAVETLAAAAALADQLRTPEYHDLLRAAVDAARDVGVGWMRIGDTLGIARGNAYQRYRKRPIRRPDSPA